MLTDEQIQNISDFCEEWGVHCYDVRMELVDHFASMIEEIYHDYPEIPFDNAFILARKSFGPYGLETIVKKEEKQIARKGRREQLKYLASFFLWPKIALTFLYIVLCFSLIQYSPQLAKILSIILFLPAAAIGTIYPTLFYGKTDYFIRSTIPSKEIKFVQIRPLLLFGRKNNICFLARGSQLFFNLLTLPTVSDIYGLKNVSFISGMFFLLAGINIISFLAFKEQRDRLLQYAIQHYNDAFQPKAN